MESRSRKVAESESHARMHPPTKAQSANRRYPHALCAGLACLLIGLPQLGHAAGGSKRAPTLASLIADLKSADATVVGTALDRLALRTERAAVAALGAFLHEGQPDALADHALLALGKTPSPAALAQLAEFTRHRRRAARTAAFTSVAEQPGNAANELLARGLRDSDAGVRGLCARRLGERGAKSQIEVLFLALARGVPEAGTALGKLADATAIARFDEQLARLPLHVMLGGYEQFLLRTDIDEQHKLEIVARLGEVASPTVKHFLEGLVADGAWSKQPRLATALRETAKRIDARPPRDRVKAPPGTLPGAAGVTGKP